MFSWLIFRQLEDVSRRTENIEVRRLKEDLRTSRMEIEWAINNIFTTFKWLYFSLEYLLTYLPTYQLFQQISAKMSIAGYLLPPPPTPRTPFPTLTLPVPWMERERHSNSKKALNLDLSIIGPARKQLNHHTSNDCTHQEFQIIVSSFMVKLMFLSHRSQLDASQYQKNELNHLNQK